MSHEIYVLYANNGRGVECSILAGVACACMVAYENVSLMIAGTNKASKGGGPYFVPLFQRRHTSMSRVLCGAMTYVTYVLAAQQHRAIAPAKRHQCSLGGPSRAATPTACAIGVAPAWRDLFAAAAGDCGAPRCYLNQLSSSQHSRAGGGLSRLCSSYMQMGMGAVRYGCNGCSLLNAEPLLVTGMA